MSKITTISDKGIELIKEFEAFKSEPYLCPAKVPTIGYGTTRYPNGSKVQLSDPSITEEKAVEYLKHDLHQFELAVDAMAVDTINQNQFDSLVSMCYNIGANGLKNSTLLKRVNLGEGDIKEAFLMWNKAGGKVVKGLTNRRLKEYELFAST